MPLNKYAAFPSARMEAFYLASRYRDLAIIDFSTNGHGVYNYGHLMRLAPGRAQSAFYSVPLTEVDIALGNFSRLYTAAEEAARDGYKNILLLPSSIGSVLGFDFKAYAEDISRVSGVNMFTLPLKLSDDFYSGREAFLFSMVRFVGKEKSFAESAFNLLGGDATYQAQCDHIYLSELIESSFGLKLNIDSTRNERVEAWKHIGNAKINIVTSRYAVRTAEYLKEKFGTPYVYIYPLGKAAQDSALREISDILGRTFHSERDEIYDFAVLQFSNILCAEERGVICYTDTDRAEGLKGFLETIGLNPQCYCTHKNGDFPYLALDEVIEKFHDSNDIVLSCDSVCRQVRCGIPVEYTGISYDLQVPLRDARIGTEGAYRLMRAITKKLLG